MGAASSRKGKAKPTHPSLVQALPLSDVVPERPRKRPLIFLSHRQKEWGDACHGLSLELERRGLADTWFDMRLESELVSSQMAKGIADSTVFALFLSPSLVTEDNFVLKEIRTAFELKKPIVCIADISSHHSRSRFIADMNSHLDKLASIVGMPRSGFGQCVPYASRPGPARDKMISELLARSGFNVTLVPETSLSEQAKPCEVMILGHPETGFDVCDLLAEELRKRGFSADANGDFLAGMAVVVYLTKGTLEHHVHTVEQARSLGSGLVFVYEVDTRRIGAYSDASEIFTESRHLLPELSSQYELLGFTGLTRRGGFMDAFVAKILLQIQGPAPLDLPFDPFAVPLQLCKRFMPGTRDWFFTKVDNACPVLILADTAGSGKSILFAETCRRGFGLVPTLAGSKDCEFQIGAFHFFNASDPRTTSIASCFGAISVLLCSSVEGFRRALPSNLHRLIQNESADQLFDLLIAKPSQGVLKSPMVIVIDAIDECDEPTELFRALRRYCSNPNSNLRFVVSTRSIPITFEDSVTIHLEEHQREDMSLYLKIRMEKYWGIAPNDGIISRLCELSNLSFLWLAYQESTIRELLLSGNGSVSVNSLSSLPRGLTEVYARSFDLLKSKLGLDLYKQILGIAVIAPRDPLPLNLFATAVGKRFNEELRTSLSSLLLVRTDQNIITVPHKSMRDWLIDESPDFTTVKQFHTALFNVLEPLASSNFDAFDSFADGESLELYPVKHLVYHGMECSDLKTLAQTWFLDFTHLLFWLKCSDPEVVLLDGEAFIARSSQDPSFGGPLFASVCATVSMLRLSISALQHDVRELAGQILGRLDVDHPLVKGANSWAERATRSRGMAVAVPASLSFSGLQRASGNLLRIMRGHADSVFALSITEAGQVLSCSNDKTARVWDRTRGKLLCSFAEHTDDVLCGWLGSDGWAVTGSNDNSARKWKVRTDGGDTASEIVFQGHTSAVVSLHVNNDAIITGSWDKTARIWNWKSGSVIACLSDAHLETVYGVYLISPEEAITGADAIRFWNIQQKTVTRTITLTSASLVFCMVVTPHLIYAAGDRFVERIRVSDGEHLATIVSESNICALDVQRNFVAVGCEDHLLRVWNTDDDTLRILEGHRNWVSAVRLSSDARILVSGSWDHTICVWKVPVEATALNSLGAEKHRGYVTCLDVNGDQVVTGSLDKTVRVWNLQSGAHLASFEAPFSVYSVTWKQANEIDAKGENQETASFHFAGSTDDTMDSSKVKPALSGPGDVSFTADDESGNTEKGRYILGTCGFTGRVWQWKL